MQCHTIDSGAVTSGSYKEVKILGERQEEAESGLFSY
jgi:hypothetical protein